MILSETEWLAAIKSEPEKLKATIYRKSPLFGIPTKPLTPKGFPDGKIRIRYRPDDWAVATVKNEFGSAQYYVEEKDGFVSPSLVKAVNSTIK